MLTLHLFGPPQHFLDGQPVNVTRRKSRALLYYLAAHPEPLTREQVLRFFWPDAERAAAQQTLRTTLYGLRKSLGEALLVEEERLALAPESEVDVRRFAAALSPPTSDLQRLSETVDLYRGEFLEDFALPDSPEFEEWALVERERYQRLMLRGLAALSRLYEAHPQAEAALDTLRRALALDPFQEDLQRAALRLHYLTGDRAGAIRRYDELRRLLDDEMGVPPMEETRALYDAIIMDEVPALPPPAVPAPLLVVTETPVAARALPFTGRSQELEQLRALAGTHRLGLIEGEPGIGKTRLAEEFIRTSGAVTLRGAAHELEHALPYHPVIEALRSLRAHPEWPLLRASLNLPPVWVAEVARLLPEVAATLPPAAPTPRAADEARLWEGIHQFLLALARQRPVIFFLDDLHWADESTLALLGYLLRQSAPGPITFLATARPVTPPSSLMTLLQTLTREARLLRLPLTRLSLGDARTLAHALLAEQANAPDHEATVAEWLMQSSEGNPYILAELVRYSRDHALIGPDGSLAPSVWAAPVVPQSVYTLIQARLAGLSESARRVLDTAVAAGRDFEFEVVSRAAALSEGAALDALDELRRAALIHPIDGGLRYTFDHSLTMEVAYREVGEPRHRLLHRRVAEALESIHRANPDPVAGLLASHFTEGHAPERASPYAYRAGQLAAGLAAWAEASAFYEQALVGAEGARRGTILMALGEVLAEAGHFERASAALAEAARLAVERGDPPAAEAAWLIQGRTFILQGRFAEVMEVAQRVIGSTTIPANLARAELLWGTVLSLEGSDLAGATEHLNRAASLCQEHLGSDILANIRFEMGSVAAQQGDLDRAIAFYREALAAASGTRSEAALNWHILAHNNLAYHLHLLGEPTALEHARQGLALAEEKGVLNLLPYLLSTLGEILLAQGEVEGAERYFTEGLRLAEQLSVRERIAGLTANLGLVAQQRGETELARQRLSEALAQADALGTQHLAAQIRLWLVPLLPPEAARLYLAQARRIAERGHRQRLLDEIERLEKEARG